MRRGLLLVAILALIHSGALAQGTLTYETLLSPSLGEIRNVAVYLPEGYDPEGMTSYPVIYFLHGAYSDDTTNWNVLKPQLDDLIGLGEIRPVIVVAPDGSGGEWGGSFWSDSPIYGQFETYVFEDVVAWADLNYLTIPTSAQRAIWGYSDGGDGCMVIGLRHADVFGVVAAHSGFFNWDHARELLRDCTLAENEGPPYEYVPAPGSCTEAVFRVSGAYSPNLENPPYLIDLPYDEDGEVIEEVVDRWKLWNADVLAAELEDGAHPAIYFDCGIADAFNYPGNVDYDAALTSMGVPHEFWSFQGGHALTAVRVGRSLAFIDAALADPAAVDGSTVPSGGRHIAAAVWPNPVRTVAQLGIRLDSAMVVGADVFNVRGQVVQTLTRGRLDPGLQVVEWSMINAPAGVYFVRVNAGNETIVKKVTVEH